MSNNAALKEQFEYAQKKLEAHYQHDEDFNNQFAIMYDYYRSKFVHIVKEEDSEVFGDYLFKSIKSQFFNGYFIIREILLNDPGLLDDKRLSQPLGIITEQLPELIIGVSGENFDNAVITDDMAKFTMWAIQRYEDIRTILRQAAFDIVCLGAKRAVLDEIDTRGLEKYVSTHERLLGSVFDVSFINPQVYLQLYAHTPVSEVWNLTWWSSLQLEDSKAGEVVLNVIETEKGNQYLLNVYLTRRTTDIEQKRILDSLVYRLMDRNNISREQVVVSFAVVEDFYILVQ